MSEAKNLKSIFGRAMELESAEERENYLDETCANQPQLRAELEKLLSSLDDASGFMTAPVIEPGATVDMPPEAEKPGTHRPVQAVAADRRRRDGRGLHG